MESLPTGEENDDYSKQIFEQPRDSETRSGSVFDQTGKDESREKPEPKFSQHEDKGMHEMVQAFGGDEVPPKEQPPRKASKSDKSNESKDG